MVPPPPETTPAQFGAAIRVLRESQQRTIEDLAACADLHWTFVSGIENGKRNPSWTSATKLSVALGVDLGEIALLASKQRGKARKRLGRPKRKKR